METSLAQFIGQKMAVAAHVRRWRLLANRLRNYCGRLYSEKAASRGSVYTTDLAQATISLTSTRPLPAYHIMDNSGVLLDSQQDPDVIADVMCILY